ncbi:MAG TPA: hypothetical protein VFM99_07655 [Chitinophagales bacterium]|nr:hypothetical protein [Chitinophagales bacterium]
MNYEHAFSGRTKNSYFAVCFKLNIGNYYTVVLKEGNNVGDQIKLTSEKFNVYNGYTRLTGEIFDIEPFEATLFDYFEETKRKIEAAKKDAIEVEAKRFKMLASFGNDISKIAGYCYANKLPVTRNYIKNKSLKIAEIKKIVSAISGKQATRKIAASFNDYYCRQRTKKEMILRNFKHLVGAAKHLPASLYSMGEMKIIYISGIEISRYNNCQEYRGGKWKARHGLMKVNLSVSEAKNTNIVGGIITVTGELVGRGLRAAKWITKAEGCYDGIEWINGYVAGDYHFTANSVSNAKDIAKRYYAEKRERELKERHNAAALKRSDKKTWVSYEDSLKGGNCSSGTNNFANVIRFNTSIMGAIRADFLLKKATEHKVLSFAERAVNAAKMRYAGIQ